MAESFFSDFFEGEKKQTPANQPAAKPPAATPPTPSAAAPAPTVAPPAAPNPPAASNASTILETRLIDLERQLSQERERALRYEIQFKEMQNAQSSVEEMFEKLWTRANKDRGDEELRVVREKSMARTEILEKRLDEFQKGLLEMIRDMSSKSSQIREELQKEMSSQVQSQLLNQSKKIEDELVRHSQEALDHHTERIQQLWKARESQFEMLIEEKMDALWQRWRSKEGQMDTLVEEKFTELNHKWRAGLEMLLEDLRRKTLAKAEEAVGGKVNELTLGIEGLAGKIESVQASSANKMMELEKVWNYLFNDVKEISSTVSTIKGTVENLETSALLKMRRDFEEQVQLFSNQWTERLASLEARILREDDKLHEEAIRGLREMWAKEMGPAKEAMLLELRGTMEWQQLKTLWERVEDIGNNLLKFGESSATTRSALHRDLSALAGELESTRLQVRTANQSIRHVEEALRMVLQLVQTSKSAE